MCFAKWNLLWHLCRYDMHFCISAVKYKPLKVFMPITGPLDNRSNAYFRTVIGQGVY